MTPITGKGFLEVVLDAEEFRAKLDIEKPVHYRGWFNVGSHGTRLLYKFRIYGWAKAGHVLVFERRWEEAYFNGEEGERKLTELTNQYARPLGATPGRLAALDREMEAEA